MRIWQSRPQAAPEDDLPSPLPRLPCVSPCLLWATLQTVRLIFLNENTRRAVMSFQQELPAGQRTGKTRELWRWSIPSRCKPCQQNNSIFVLCMLITYHNRQNRVSTSKGYVGSLGNASRSLKTLHKAHRQAMASKIKKCLCSLLECLSQGDKH